MKKFILIISLIVISSVSYAGIADSVYIGYSSGYSSYDTYRGELYLRFNPTVLNRNSEFKIGVNNRSYQLPLADAAWLEASSIGLFADLAIYPFNKGLFAGLRWELINFNWLSDDSANRFDGKSTYTGTCLFFQLGYHFKVNEYMGIKVYGQPGIQQFRISDGSLTAGNTTSNSNNLISQEHYEFIYNINVSIDLRIK